MFTFYAEKFTEWLCITITAYNKTASASLTVVYNLTGIKAPLGKSSLKYGAYNTHNIPTTSFSPNGTDESHNKEEEEEEEEEL